ncbi:MAG: hypothetical protein RI904_828 [Pseudomonadota bacterium]
MLTLFFVDDLPAGVGVRYEFNNEDAHHAIKVLRLSPGERFNLGDGKGAWSRVVIENVNKKSMTVKVLESGFQQNLQRPACDCRGPIRMDAWCKSGSQSRSFS